MLRVYLSALVVWSGLNNLIGWDLVQICSVVVKCLGGYRAVILVILIPIVCWPGAVLCLGVNDRQFWV